MTKQLFGGADELNKYADGTMVDEYTNNYINVVLKEYITDGT